MLKSIIGNLVFYGFFYRYIYNTSNFRKKEKKYQRVERKNLACMYCKVNGFKFTSHLKINTVLIFSILLKDYLKTLILNIYSILISFPPIVYVAPSIWNVALSHFFNILPLRSATGSGFDCGGEGGLFSITVVL